MAPPYIYKCVCEMWACERRRKVSLAFHNWPRAVMSMSRVLLKWFWQRTLLHLHNNWTSDGHRGTSAGSNGSVDARECKSSSTPLKECVTMNRVAKRGGVVDGDFLKVSDLQNQKDQSQLCWSFLLRSCVSAQPRW